MRYNPFETLHRSLASAFYHDMPPVIEQHIDWVASKDKGEQVYRTTMRPADMQDVSINMFVQTWSDTSCGFGGFAGQAFTDAYTIVLFREDLQTYYVYIGGRYVYCVEQKQAGFNEFLVDLQHHDIAGKLDCGRYK